jgi:hypothetical protein
MIEILVQKGYPVLFPTRNANTIAIENQIDFLNKQSQGNQFNTLTVFFRSIEHIIEKYCETVSPYYLPKFFKKSQILLEQKVGLYHDNHNSNKKKTGEKAKVLSTTLTNYPSIQNFTLLLPLIEEGSGVEGLTIMEYFTAILTGHVPQSQLFLVPFDEDERPSAKPRTNMTRKQR